MNDKVFFQKINHLKKENLPFVAFKYPNRNTLFLINQQNDDLENFLHLEQKGFVMHDFLGNHSFVIRTDQCSECQDFSIHQPKPLREKYLLTDKKSHIALIEKAIKCINNEEFKKVVLSKKVSLALEEKQSMATYFERLISSYPTAFCYLMHHPKVGCWLAATPETLLQVTDDDIFTMSLAGTQPYIMEKECIWEEKEKEEQQIVTDNIIKKIANFTNKINISPVKTLIAGQLAHICTEISAKVKREHLLELIKTLHPTPAVCGYPTENAKKFILKNEEYSREFYTGFCGLINFTAKDQHQLFVNLRCTQLVDNNAFIYIGGGITHASIPEKEWEEIQNKAQTMLQILT